MNNFRYATTLTCLLMLTVSTAAQQLYVCSGKEAHEIDMAFADEMVFNDTTLRIGLNECYNIAAVDSITFTKPPLTTRKAGWTSGTKDNELLYYPTNIDDKFFGVYPYHIFVKDGICQNVLWGVKDNFPKETFKDYLVELQNLFSALSGTPKYHYTKRTLTRKRKLHSITYTQLITKYNLDTCYIEFGLGCDSLLYGRPVEEARRIIYLWHNPDTDTSTLPSKLYFGTYSKGHYELKEDKWGNMLTIDLTFSDDGTMVTSCTTRSIFSKEQKAEELFIDESDDETAMSLEGNTIVIEEKCNMTVEEAMENLIRFDVEFTAPFSEDIVSEHFTYPNRPILNGQRHLSRN